MSRCFPPRLSLRFWVVSVPSVSSGVLQSKGEASPRLCSRTRVSSPPPGYTFPLQKYIQCLNIFLCCGNSLLPFRRASGLPWNIILPPGFINPHYTAAPAPLPHIPRLCCHLSMTRTKEPRRVGPSSAPWRMAPAGSEGVVLAPTHGLCSAERCFLTLVIYTQGNRASGRPPRQTLLQLVARTQEHEGSSYLIPVTSCN